MKKLFVLLLLTSMLVGCGAEETFEVVEDVIPVEPVAVPQQFYVTMPEDALTVTLTYGEDGLSRKAELTPGGAFDAARIEEIVRRMEENHEHPDD